MGDHVDRVLEQWRAERPDIDASPMGIIGRIQRASRLLQRGLGEHFAQAGLEQWEFDVLATLRRSGPPYQLTAGALSRSAMVTSGAITNRVDRLVDRGLLSREVDPSNRRAVVITLTDRGWELIERLLASHVANEERLLASLSARQRQQLQDLLRTLLVGLGDEAPSPADAPSPDRGRAS